MINLNSIYFETQNMIMRLLKKLVASLFISGYTDWLEGNDFLKKTIFCMWITLALITRSMK